MNSSFQEKKTGLIQDVLSRSVEKIFPSNDFLEMKLNNGERLTFFMGIDPTGPTLHLGHGIILRKLAQLQKLGHKIIMLIGSFTAMIGDPTGKSSVRNQLTREQVLQNAKLFVEQASRFISFKGENPAELKFNGDWFDKMTFKEGLDLISNFTHGQIIKRDMFQDRIKNDQPIFLHEFIYPILQAFDSVQMDVDGEIGGNDQTFNMLAGRNLLKSKSDKEKIVIAMKLLSDNSGKKMGKSEMNMVSFIDSPKDMFGKIMSWSDEMILSGFELATEVSIGEIESMKVLMQQGDNPRDFKMKLAFEVVKDFHGADVALLAEEEFKNMFQKKKKPSEIKEFKVSKSKIGIIELLRETQLVQSNSDARRLIKNRGVRINDVRVSDISLEVEIPSSGLTLQKGKLHFLKIKT